VYDTGSFYENYHNDASILLENNGGTLDSSGTILAAGQTIKLTIP